MIRMKLIFIQIRSKAFFTREIYMLELTEKRQDISISNKIINTINVYVKANYEKIKENKLGERTAVIKIARSIYEKMGVPSKEVDKCLMQITKLKSFKLKIFFDETDSRYDPYSWNTSEFSLDPVDIINIINNVRQTIASMKSGFFTKNPLRKLILTILDEEKINTLEILNNDVLLLICSFLYPGDLVSLSITSKFFQQFTQYAGLWQKFIFSAYNQEAIDYRGLYASKPEARIFKYVAENKLQSKTFLSRFKTTHPLDNFSRDETLKAYDTLTYARFSNSNNCSFFQVKLDHLSDEKKSQEKKGIIYVDPEGRAFNLKDSINNIPRKSIKEVVFKIEGDKKIAINHFLAEEESTTSTLSK